MQITRVRIEPFENGKLRAFVGIIFDNCFAVNGLKIIQAQTGLLVVMPSEKTKNGRVFRDCIPDQRTDAPTPNRLSPRTKISAVLPIGLSVAISDFWNSVSVTVTATRSIPCPRMVINECYLLSRVRARLVVLSCTVATSKLWLKPWHRAGT